MAEKTNFIGIDLGGTNIKAALVNTDTGEISYTVATTTSSGAGPAW